MTRQAQTRPAGAGAAATAGEAAADEPMDFVALLEDRARAMRERPKRVRTRARLLAAVAREIARNGYDGLTVEGICADAGMARGTFYLYYRHRSDAATAVYRLFWVVMHRQRPRLPGATLADKIRISNLFYLKTYAQNAPLLAGQAALGRERPDFALQHDRMNHRWSLVIAANMPGDMPRDIKVLRARALVAMADDLLSNIFTRRMPSLVHWAEDPERLGACLSELWTRIVVDGGSREKGTQ
ncbi:TetR/AcrR family transcriptional regulator [Aquibium sp. A9E412]|uniref:TetR/AcrR family transcriptional regulator n=1 Tax=Aquibium sp. A9E412 TaxID=2976767 RepID=UPI0025B1A1DA|nr:TetR/AcrR family transcriptional regulator [Aquibium sp. A9E412]MDN2567634.1 TetR/AcrR family transcriptional regulator [Aquibium sp. A9E412]